ncbi:MAG: hypothetical protein ACYC1M_15225 [Armatimonadota bacterium]
MPFIYHVYKLLLICIYGAIVYACYHDGSLGEVYGNIIVVLLLVPAVLIWVASWFTEPEMRLRLNIGHGVVLVAAIGLLLLTMLFTGDQLNSMTLGAIAPAAPVLLEAWISYDFFINSAHRRYM